MSNANSSSSTLVSVSKSTLFCYRPPTKLREGKVFTGVCHSVGGGGRGLSEYVSRDDHQVSLAGVDMSRGRVVGWGYIQVEWVYPESGVGYIRGGGWVCPRGGHTMGSRILSPSPPVLLPSGRHVI